MEETKIVFKLNYGEKKEFILTNFKDESKSLNHIHSYKIKQIGNNESYLIENEGSSRSKTTNVSFRPRANNEAFRQFFKQLNNIANDEVASYFNIEQVDNYFLIELRNCKSISSLEFSNEPLAFKAKILASILDTIIKVDSFHLRVKENNRRACTLIFDDNSFKYSKLTEKAYLYDFNQLYFSKALFLINLSNKKDYKHFLENDNKIRSVELEGFIKYCLKTLSSPDNNLKQNELIESIEEERSALKLKELLEELSIPQSQKDNFKDALIARYSRLRSEKDFNPLLNVLVNQFGDVSAETFTIVSNIEETIREMYNCTNFNKLSSLVQFAEENIKKLADEYKNYKLYRTHSLNVEYAKRLLEDGQSDGAYKRAEIAFKSIGSLCSNIKLDDKYLKVYVYSCLLESAWVACLALSKNRSNNVKFEGYGQKSLYFSDYNVREYGEEVVRLYEEIYEKEPSVENARHLVTSLRNLGVYLEDYRIGGDVSKNKEYIKNLYLKAYELMQKFSPELDNPKLYHCLISYNLKIAKSLLVDERNFSNIKDEEEYIKLLRTSKHVFSTREILNENINSLKHMADSGFAQSKSYILLRMMNDFYLTILMEENEDLYVQNLKKDVAGYCFIFGEEQFEMLNNSSAIKFIIDRAKLN